MGQPAGEPADKTTEDKDAKAAGSGQGADDQSGKAKEAADKAHDGAEDTAGLKKALQAERKLRQDLEKAQRDAELAKLPELERAQTEALALKAEVEKLSLENQRRKIAMDLNLPWSIGKRLSGDTEDEMRADGAELLKHYKIDDKKIVPEKDDPKNKKPVNDGKAKGSSGGPDMNTLLRAAAGRLR